MKNKKAQEVVTSVVDMLFAEIEREVLKDLNFDIFNGRLRVYNHDFRIVTSRPLLSIAKDCVENADDTRVHLELAAGFERVAKWLRKDAKRLT